jgi:DNA excision repair protein ERCC-4
MTNSATQVPLVIHVDHREAGAPIVALLAACPDVRVEMRHLALGDYLVDGRILFERKTLADLAKSIIDGRLFEQGIRLACQSIVPVIILEGRSEASCRGMTREAIQGALVMLTLVLGIPLLRSSGPEETARLILYASAQSRRVVHRALPRQGKRPSGKRRTQLAILQELPGVGPDRAARLLSRFGSVVNVMNASFEELRQVPGIGSTVARAIRRAVG